MEPAGAKQHGAGRADTGLCQRTTALARCRHCPDSLRLPQAEGIDRPRRPASTGVAVTVAHGHRLSAHLQGHGAAEAATDGAEQPAEQTAE